MVSLCKPLSIASHNNKDSLSQNLNNQDSITQVNPTQHNTDSLILNPDNTQEYFDYSKQRQKDKDKGAIPEGTYYIDINKSTDNTQSGIRTYNNTWYSLSRTKEGAKQWGKHNIPIYTDKNCTNTTESTTQRENFYIHGGESYGDNGGIDLSKEDNRFFQALESLKQEYKDILESIKDDRGRIIIKLEVGYEERKSEIDLRGKRTPNGGVVEWISQFNVIFGTLEKQKTACNRACVYILQNAGVSQIETPINNKVTYQIAIEKGVGYKERNKVYERNQNINIATTTNPSDYMQVDIQTFEAGLSYLDSELERGYPVVVGTDHHYNYNGGYNNDLSTDHFVVIVGRGYDTKGLFYRFYEVGTNREDANKKKFGISDDNKFYIENNTLQGKPAHKLERNYLVTQIRRNKTYKERK